MRLPHGDWTWGWGVGEERKKETERKRGREKKKEGRKIGEKNYPFFRNYDSHYIIIK
jgi:hypothetical protein